MVLPLSFILGDIKIKLLWFIMLSELFFLKMLFLTVQDFPLLIIADTSTSLSSNLPYEMPKLDSLFRIYLA